MRLVPKVIVNHFGNITHDESIWTEEKSWYDCLQCLLLQVRAVFKKLFV